MDIIDDKDIYAAISGIIFPIDEYSFGHGIIISKTFAHVFGPYMVAFRKPEKSGFHHPGPWKSIGGGVAFDIWHELIMPKEIKLFKEIDNLNTIWIIAALMRLRLSPFIAVPVISSVKFSEIESSKSSVTFHAIEPIQSNLFSKIEIDQPDIQALDWIKQYFITVGKLYEANDKYAFALLCIDRAITETRYSMALMTLWGAIEQIFSTDDKQELSYRISLNVASYLEERGDQREALFKRVRKLYNARSRAAHGSPSEDKSEFVETYNLLKRVIIKITEAGLTPNQALFEKRIMA